MKKLLAILSFTVCLLPAWAQDIHFSQFYNSPLTLNPALTGNIDGKFRVGAIYRNQWKSVGSPFKTISASFDLGIHRLKKGDVFGVGLMAFHDKTGTVGLSNINIVASAAYHKPLGVNKSHVLSMGVQVGFTQRRIDMSEAIFADQVDNTLTNIGGSGDAANLGTSNHEELNIGLGYSAKFGKRSNLYIGGSMFHVSQPKESVLGSGERLPSRYVGHASMDIGIGKMVSILPSFIYMNQAGNNEINVGSGIRVAFKEDIRATIGAYYRLQDAVIPMVGFEVKGLNMAFSYDVNTSSLNNVSNSQGGYEISVFYVMPFKKTPFVPSVIYNPRF
ncbi:MAG: PorP/SprF family type IX secretion system membrane protein [Chitinophagales bacterium]|nr:PorP/SprF family type IX secretion system membrane protein [Chitinophagales bacterium]